MPLLRELVSNVTVSNTTFIKSFLLYFSFVRTKCFTMLGAYLDECLKKGQRV